MTRHFWRKGQKGKFFLDSQRCSDMWETIWNRGKCIIGIGVGGRLWVKSFFFSRVCTDSTPN